MFSYSSYKPINSTLKSMVLSMLREGRITHTPSVKNIEIIRIVLIMLEDNFHIDPLVSNERIIAHYACLYLFNEPSFHEMRYRFPRSLKNKREQMGLIVKARRNGKKIYYGKHVTLEMYKTHGRSILLTSKYYQEDCFADEGFLDDLVNVDRPLSLPISNEVIRKVIARMKFLINNHEEYWIYIASELYTLYMKRVYGLSNLTDLDGELVKELLQFHDSFDTRKLVESGMFNRAQIKIALPKLAYILGVPSGVVNSCLYSASSRKIQELVERVKKDPEGHLARIREKNIHNMTIFVENASYMYDKAELCNLENIFMENIVDYHEFDILHYCDDDGHIFSFTRDEFPSMLKEKEKNNPYNRIPLSENFVQLMQSRVSLNKMIGECKPVRDLWEENGILTNIKPETKDVYIPAKTYSRIVYAQSIHNIREKLLDNVPESSFDPRSFVRNARQEERNSMNDIMGIYNNIEQQASRQESPPPSQEQSSSSIFCGLINPFQNGFFAPQGFTGPQGPELQSSSSTSSRPVTANSLFGYIGVQGSRQQTPSSSMLTNTRLFNSPTRMHSRSEETQDQRSTGNVSREGRDEFIRQSEITMGLSDDPYTETPITTFGEQEDSLSISIPYARQPRQSRQSMTHSYRINPLRYNYSSSNGYTNQAPRTTRYEEQPTSVGYEQAQRLANILGNMASEEERQTNSSQSQHGFGDKAADRYARKATIGDIERRYAETTDVIIAANERSRTLSHSTTPGQPTQASLDTFRYPSTTLEENIARSITTTSTVDIEDIHEDSDWGDDIVQESSDNVVESDEDIPSLVDVEITDAVASDSFHARDLYFVPTISEEAESIYSLD